MKNAPKRSNKYFEQKYMSPRTYKLFISHFN